jgi:hypothetical protein
MSQPRPSCPVCNETSHLRPNNGGFYFKTTCGAEWHLNGRSSGKLHGNKVVSFKEQVLAALRDEGIDPESALAEYGIEGCIDLLELKHLKVRKS